MASGDTLLVFTAEGAGFPATNPGTPDTRNNRLVLDFDAATDETVYFLGIMPQHYAGTTGVTVHAHTMASTATTGNFMFEVGFDNLVAQDADSDGFAANNASGAQATSGTSGIPSIDTITFTDGADMDSVAAGNLFRIRFMRDADNASDTMAGDLELIALEIRET